jgi:hypothetical protein
MVSLFLDLSIITKAIHRFNPCKSKHLGLKSWMNWYNESIENGEPYATQRITP